MLSSSTFSALRGRCQWQGTSWIGNFTQYCQAHGVPYDFVSNHNYAGCGEPGTIGNIDNLLRAQTAARKVIGNEVPFVITEFGAACTQGAGVNAAMAAAAQAGTSGGGGANSYPGGKVNAMDGFANGGWWHDVEHQAAFVIAAVDALAAGGYESLSYWAFSDVLPQCHHLFIYTDQNSGLSGSCVWRAGSHNCSGAGI